MVVPGVKTAYPFLPGGATASLTDFSFLTDSIASQTGMGAVALLAPGPGAALLCAYALAASVAAILVPLRRDVG